MQGGLSRRGFARWLGAGIGLAATPATGAGLRLVRSLGAAASAPALGTARVRLSANENPYGPSPAALEAMRSALPLACRYPDEQAEALRRQLAAAMELSADSVLVADGSSEVLRLAVAACAGPGRRVVVADPTFEAVAAHASSTGIELVKVPLTADFRHDLQPMLAAVRGAGLIYVCNPNNPTASTTPAAELNAFLRAVPADVVVLVDEAYHHYASGGGYASVLPLTKELPNLLVARTFSKIYGMAGLRCGLAVAQPPLLARLRAQRGWDTLNVMALVAASASLRDNGHVESCAQRNAAVRREVVDALAAKGLAVIPSQANFLMVSLGRPASPVIAGLRQRGVEVGREFPALPQHLRVTIGTHEEMQRFLAAFEALA